ncbi:hypothetical protein [Pseudomonas sp. CCC3.1]|uniref:hypothetical protein n=1 Tax=Pseudomonas sp. CCC3.1 TaxID=3048607 RepID=UPI002AC8EE38|nr:hypothetical protein [Pseudomonas sp. CCC3.1]MEB0205781.1 hypothetical protein [Pseudomonas sp. CCC3.1]WPX34761.1 hypothetical protein RHM56_15795 [Pseudomonas sp. CCC3.1]
MNIKNAGYVALLASALLLMSGCDQAEKAAQQMLSKTAETAKQAIDDTHKAAEQALNDATGGRLIEKEKPAQENKDSSHTI